MKTYSEIITSLLILMFVWVGNVFADAPPVQWEKTYGGANNDWGMDVKQTSDGGYIVAGFTFSFGDGYYESDNFNPYPSSSVFEDPPPYEPLNGKGNWSSVGWNVMHDEIPFDSNYAMVRHHPTGSNNHATYHLTTIDNITSLTVGFKYSEQRNADLTVYTSPDNTNWTEVTSRFALRMEPSLTDVFDDLSSFTSGYGQDAYIRFKTDYWSGNYWMDEIDDFWVTGVKAKAYLVKTDVNGNKIWQKTYGGAGSFYGYSVKQTNDGGYIVAGRSYPDGASDCDVWIMKTDANGDTIWTKTYGGAGREYGYSVDCTSDGGYVIGGVTSSFGAGGSDFWLLRTDADGDTLWTKTYGGTRDDYGYSAKQIVDGGYVIVGATYSYGAGNNDARLIRTDANGNPLWAKTYGGSDWNECYSIQQTDDGGFIIAGKTYYDDAPYSDQAWLIRTDTNGSTIWEKEHGDGGAQGYRSVQQTVDDGYIAAGYTYGVDSWGGRVYITRTDISGDSLWTVTHGGPRTAGGYSVRQTSDRGYIIAGVTNSTGAGEYDVYLVKLTGITVQATIDIDPNTLNLTSRGEWVTCYIELPEGYSVEDIYLSTVAMTAIDDEPLDPPLYREGPTAIGDEDEDGIPDLMVKFGRQDLIAILAEMVEPPADVKLTVSGELTDDTPFEGSDVIRVIHGREDTKVKFAAGPMTQRQTGVPISFVLEESEPNPFSAQTSIRYALPLNSHVRIEIMDVSGRVVAVLLDDVMNAGYHTINWNGCDNTGKAVSSGVYFLRFKAGDHKYTEKLILLR